VAVGWPLTNDGEGTGGSASVRVGAMDVQEAVSAPAEMRPWGDVAAVGAIGDGGEGARESVFTRVDTVVYANTGGTAPDVVGWVPDIVGAAVPLGDVARSWRQRHWRGRRAPESSSRLPWVSWRCWTRMGVWRGWCTYQGWALYVALVVPP
jgi:hypothetical protein